MKKWLVLILTLSTLAVVLPSVRALAADEGVNTEQIFVCSNSDSNLVATISVQRGGWNVGDGYEAVRYLGNLKVNGVLGTPVQSECGWVGHTGNSLHCAVDVAGARYDLFVKASTDSVESVGVESADDLVVLQTCSAQPPAALPPEVGSPTTPATQPTDDPATHQPAVN